MTDLPNSESTDAILVDTRESSTSPFGSKRTGRQTQAISAVGSGATHLSHGSHWSGSEGVFVSALEPSGGSFLSASTGAVTLLHLESQIENLEKAQALKDFAEELTDEMIEQPPEAARAVEENFWDLF